MFNPRPLQQRVIEYTHGKMGVSAVPGSGKTHTLSYLAANLIKNGYIQEDQEILIVTLVNSAVNNFSTRITSFIKSYNLLPGVGYRVRTLHGLAHDIVRQRPDLAGLPNHFQIVDEGESEYILKSAVQSWMNSHREFLQKFTDPDIDLYRDHKVMQRWQETAIDIAGAFIRQAKDLEATPATVRQKAEQLNLQQPLLEMGCDIYSDYQRALNYRSAVDFDDLIRLALRALRSDADFTARLRYYFPYILEDEAQDSSRLQEEILRCLVGEDGNWVRVGDPNQAIFETFTTANPKYLIDFLQEPGVTECKLANSGRSTPSIIRLANYLVDWTRNEHPVETLRDALYHTVIEPVPPGDPQPNPKDNPDGIHLALDKSSPDEELEKVTSSLKRWVDDPVHKEETAAVLVPSNRRGAQVVECLGKVGIEIVELLKSSSSTRQTARDVAYILHALADPTSSSKLVKVYQILSRYNTADEKEEHEALIEATASQLRKCVHMEKYLYPRPDQDWLAELNRQGTPVRIMQELEWFRPIIHTWHSATLLPIDQLILTISQDIFTDPVELALVHKLALAMEHTAQLNPEWKLYEFSVELERIANNERKYMGFSDEDTGFDPDQHRGKVVVATMHKAKGLEWDRVYLLSVNNYDFPSAQDADTFVAEKYFVRGKLNLQAETLAKLQYLIAEDTPGVYIEEGIATQEARLDYARERLRLLYVGITRARKELIIIWNTGQRGNCQPALPLVALQSYWEEDRHDAAI